MLATLSCHLATKNLSSFKGRSDSCKVKKVWQFLKILIPPNLVKIAIPTAGSS